MAVDAKTGQPIYSGVPGAKAALPGNFQVAGIPFVTGGLIPSGQEVKVQFPAVTKQFTVIASGSADNLLRVHFNSQSASANVYNHNHYIELDSDEDSMEFNVRCKEVYISSPADTAGGGYQLLASLPHILQVVSAIY